MKQVKGNSALCGWKKVREPEKALRSGGGSVTNGCFVCVLKNHVAGIVTNL